MTQKLHPKIQLEIENRKKQIARLRALDVHVKKIASIFSIDVMKQQYGDKKSIGLTYDQKVALYAQYPHVMADADDLRSLARAGYHMVGDPWVDKSDGDSHYEFKHKDWKFDEQVPVILYCRLASDSPTCKKVKVGERVERYPVYEVRCEGEEPKIIESDVPVTTATPDADVEPS